MLRDTFGNLELIDLLRSNLFGMTAQDEMDLVRGAIDLLEQSLQINRSAGTSGGEDKFHRDQFEFNRISGQ